MRVEKPVVTATGFFFGLVPIIIGDWTDLWLPIAVEPTKPR
jgi:hypothetical protein